MKNWRELYDKIPAERRVRIEEAVNAEIVLMEADGLMGDESDWTVCDKGCGRKLICVHDIFADNTPRNHPAAVPSTVPAQKKATTRETAIRHQFDELGCAVAQIETLSDANYDSVQYLPQINADATALLRNLASLKQDVFAELDAKLSYCHLCQSYFSGDPEGHGLGECVGLCSRCLEHEVMTDEDGNEQDLCMTCSELRLVLCKNMWRYLTPDEIPMQECRGCGRPRTESHQANCWINNLYNGQGGRDATQNSSGK